MNVAYDLEPELQAKALRLRDDFDFFSRNCLKIRSKTGEMSSLRMNRLQRHLHERLEAQLKTKGKVRAICVKGRQGGCSTYLEGRFYWKAWGARKALQVFILTHEQPATENLFGMAQRYHDNMPEGLKPPTTTANAKQLDFADNGAGYAVATAGTRGIGRSATFQLFHGSEVAYWPNAEDHIAGVFQTVGNAPGTEIVLESTANGVGNLFHRLAMASVRGANDYELIFIPWFWSEDYEEPCPSTWEPSKQWVDYGTLHRLEWPQLYWAYLKNRELAQSIGASEDEPCWKFKQEYPATFDEAFQSSGSSFIPGIHVMRARLRKPDLDIIGRGPIILGVDPARGGEQAKPGSDQERRSGDKVGVIDRCGRRMGQRVCERIDPQGSLVHVAQRVATIIDRIKPDAVNIDVGGVGAGVYDFLLEKGYGGILNAVNFGSAPIGRGPTGDEMYANRRAEMWDLMRDWFNGEAPVQIPDDDGLQADITAPEWGPQGTRHNTGNELILEDKDKIKARLGASPDLGDAAALTFAVPFAEGMMAQNQPRPQRRTNSRTGY